MSEGEPSLSPRGGGLRAALNGSLRRQLIAWNIGTLTVLMGLLGVSVRVVVGSLLMVGIRRNLEANLSALPPPGFGAGKGGDHNERPPNDVPPSPGPPRPHRFSMGRGGPGEQEPGPEPGPPPNHNEDARGRPTEGVPPSEHGPSPERDTNIYAARHFDLQGKPLGVRVLLDAQGFARAKTGQNVFSRVVVNGVPLQVLTVPFRRRGQIVAVGQAAYPVGETERTLADLTTALLLLVPLGLSSAGIGGALLTTRVLRRVGQTARAAEQITVETSGDVSARLPVMGNDEFAELARAFNDLLGRLELAGQKQAHLLDQQRRFTADASHELKTPLTVIRGAATLLLGESGESTTSADYQKVLQRIDHASLHMGNLVGDLLLLARSDSGQVAKSCTELLIEDILVQARAMVTGNGGTAGGETVSDNYPPIQIKSENPALTVRGNETELIRVFTNILDNGARHTPSTGRINVSVRQVGEQILIAVADTGSGIGPEHLGHLGERFYRVDEARTRTDRRGGTGLGLAIVKSLVEAHGGSLSIASQAGLGTTVTVVLPNGE